MIIQEDNKLKKPEIIPFSFGKKARKLSRDIDKILYKKEIELKIRNFKQRINGFGIAKGAKPLEEENRD
jgi:hypothetical protein